MNAYTNTNMWIPHSQKIVISSDIEWNDEGEPSQEIRYDSRDNHEL